MSDAKLRIPERIAPGDFIIVHSAVSHPLERVLGRTVLDEEAPAFAIREAVVTYGDQVVARFAWAPGATRDPIVSFKLRADREAPITLMLRDDEGGVFRKSVDVVFHCSTEDDADPTPP